MPADVLAFDLDNTLYPVLPGQTDGWKDREVLCTNSHMFHAEHVLDRLGVRRHFVDIIDISRMDFCAKPDVRAIRTIYELRSALEALRRMDATPCT